MKISTTWMLCWVAASLAVCGCAGMRPTRDIAIAPTAAESSDSTERAVARLCERRGESDKAKQMYALFLQQNPRDAEAHHRLAVIACKEDQFERAEEHFRAALAVAPNHPLILGDLGYALYLQNRLPEAEEYLTRALQSDPQLTSAHNNLGLVLGQQQRYSESLAMFRRTGSESEAFANLAFVHARQGNLDPAETFYSQALTANPKLRPAAHGLMQIAQRKQMLQMQGQQIDAKAIAQAKPNSPATAVAVTKAPAAEGAPVADNAPLGRAQPPQFVMDELPAEARAGNDAMSESSAQPGRRFVADEFVELVDASETTEQMQPLPPVASLPDSIDRRSPPQDRVMLTANSQGTPTRFAVATPRPEAAEEHTPPAEVQPASPVRPPAPPTAPRNVAPAPPAAKAENTPRLQMRYAEGVKLTTLEASPPVAEAQPEPGVDAPLTMKSAPLVLKVVAPPAGEAKETAAEQTDAPAEPAKPLTVDQQLPRTVFHLGTRQPTPMATEPQPAITVEQPAEAVTPAPPSTNYSTPRLQWSGPTASRFSNSQMDRTRRTSDEFRAAPQHFSGEPNAAQRTDR